MKIQLTEREYGFEFELTPDDVKDASLLLRMSSNVSAERPQVFTSFANGVTGYITLKQMTHKNRRNYISTRKK